MGRSRGKSKCGKGEFNTRVDAPPPPPSYTLYIDLAAPPESIIRGGYRGLTGKGTIVAILGYRHRLSSISDFINTIPPVTRPRGSRIYGTPAPVLKSCGTGSEAPFESPTVPRSARSTRELSLQANYGLARLRYRRTISMGTVRPVQRCSRKWQRRQTIDRPQTQRGRRRCT